MFLAHGPVGYIVNEAIQKKEISKLKNHEQLIVGILSILFGILPRYRSFSSFNDALFLLSDIMKYLHTHQSFTLGFG